MSEIPVGRAAGGVARAKQLSKTQRRDIGGRCLVFVGGVADDGCGEGVDVAGAFA